MSTTSRGLCALALTLLCASCGADDEDPPVPDDAGATGDDAAVENDAGAGLDAAVDGGGDPVAAPWPMFGHDARRTNRSHLAGPATYTEGSARNWTYEAAGANSINMQATVTDDSVFFGTWGVQRRAPAAPPEEWVKFDGKIFGLDAATGQERFAPFDPLPLPACYRYDPHPKVGRDDTFCGDDNDLHVAYFNGTIEGTPLVDPRTGVLYVGRGDGNLYAVDPADGTVRWTFHSFNPEDPDDPDGGGEIVGGAVVDARGLVYFATWGLPWPGSEEDPGYETHAVYAVDRDGDLVWRFPSEAARLDNPLLAAPALSPDGDTLYVASWLSDSGIAGRLIALDLTVAPEAPDEARVRWELVLESPDRPGNPRLWVRSLSVGADGTIFLAGAETAIPSSAFVAAVHDDGTFAWSPAIVEPSGYPFARAHLTQGLALWEEDGAPVRVYAATAHARDLNGTGGALHVIDASTGAILATLDPEDLPEPGIGGMTPPILDAEERCYVGIRGRHDGLAQPDAPGSQWRDGTMYAVHFDAPTSELQLDWSLEVHGQLDWAAPAIGQGGGLYFGSTPSYPLLKQSHWFGTNEEAPQRAARFYAIFE